MLKALIKFLLFGQEQEFPKIIAGLPFAGVVVAAHLLAPRYDKPSRCPGWRFGLTEESGDKYVMRRLAIWRDWARRFSDRTLNVRWYNDVHLRLALGNDLNRCIYVGGAYEPNEMAFVAWYLQPGMQFIDIGANEGVYSLLAAQRVGASGKVWAVEPSKRELVRLRDNLRANCFESRVEVLEVALSSAPGRAQLRLAEPEHAGQNTLGEFIYDIQSAGEESVTLATLDERVRSASIMPDLIKMDVEGVEWEVLKGARDVLVNARPIVLCEQAVEDGGILPGAVAAFWRALDYELFHFMSDGLPNKGLPDAAGVYNLLAVPAEKSARIREYNLG